MKRLIPIVALLCLIACIDSFGQGILPYVDGGFRTLAGANLALGKICTTVSGTSTNLATYPTYADAVALTNANTNPVLLNAFGRPDNSSGEIWIAGGSAYRIRIIAAGTGGTACNGDTAVGVNIQIVDGITSGASIINALTINGVQMCDQYPGATAGAKIAACIAALPATGGVANAIGLQGVQTWSSCPTTGVSKPVTLIVSGSTTTVSVDCTVPRNVTLTVLDGTTFSINGGVTFTLNGLLSTVSNPSDVFTGAGTRVISGVTPYPMPSPTRLGSLTQSTLTHASGAMTAGTYYWTVAGRNYGGGVSLAPVDTWATYERNFTIGGADNAAILGWKGDPRFSSYLVGLGSASGQYTTWFEAASNSISIYHNPAARPAFTFDHCTANGANTAPPCAAGVLGFALVNTGVAENTLRSGCYYSKVEAVMPSSWSSATTGPIVDMVDDKAAMACIAAADDKTASITYNWTVPVDTVSSNLVLSSMTQGGVRGFLWRKSVGAVTTYTLTTAPETPGFSTFTPVFGNFDLQTAAAAVVGSVQTISDGRSNFAGDIYISGPINTESQIVTNMTNSTGTTASTSVYTGHSYRWNTNECWRQGMFATDGPNTFQLKYPGGTACASGSTNTALSIDALNELFVTPYLMRAPGLSGGNSAGSTLLLRSTSSGAPSGDFINFNVGNTNIGRIYKFQNGWPLVTGGTAVSGQNSNTQFTARQSVAGDLVVSEIYNDAAGAAGNGGRWIAMGLPTSGSTPLTIGGMTCLMASPTTTTTDGKCTFTTSQGTVMTTYAGLQVGSPTGGDKGAGSINIAADIYKNDTAYTNPDYVFERHFTGKIIDNLAKSGAKSYRGLLSLSEVEEHARLTHQLPGVATATGMFERSDILLEKLEEAYLYIFELNRRIKLLEAKSP